LDGKTLRGTIPLGQSSGVHFLAAYHADQGVVLAQLAVDTKVNEIVVAPAVDFTTSATIEQGHGRLEQRVLTASSLLADYQDWPYLAQIVKVKRTRTTKLKATHEVAYGIHKPASSGGGCGALVSAGTRALAD
jgi:hypothetical protein